jgi:hypothetical protein
MPQISDFVPVQQISSSGEIVRVDDVFHDGRDITQRLCKVVEPGA